MASRRPNPRRADRQEEKFTMDDLRSGTARISLTSWLVTGSPIVRRPPATKGSGGGGNAARTRSGQPRGFVEDIEEAPKKEKAGSPAQNDDGKAGGRLSSDMEVQTSGSDDYDEILNRKENGQKMPASKKETKTNEKDDAEVIKKDEAKAAKKEAPEACEKESGVASRVKMKTHRPKDWAPQVEERAVYVQMMNGKGQVKPVLIRKRTRSKSVAEMLDGAIQHYHLANKSESGYVADSSDVSDPAPQLEKSKKSVHVKEEASDAPKKTPPPNKKKAEKKTEKTAKKSDKRGGKAAKHKQSDPLATTASASDADTTAGESTILAEKTEKKKTSTAKNDDKKAVKAVKHKQSKAATATISVGDSDMTAGESTESEVTVKKHAKPRKKSKSLPKEKELKKAAPSAKDQPPQGAGEMATAEEVAPAPAPAHDPTTSGADDEGPSPTEQQQADQQARQRESTYLHMLRDYYQGQMSGLGMSALPRLDPDPFFSADDCEVLAVLHCKRAVEGWMELQAEFYNMTGRMVDVSLLREKISQAGRD